MHAREEIKSMTYIVPKKRGVCCTNKNEKHERCDCLKDISFCKSICNEDQACKGYAGDGATVCQIATTSICPGDCQKASIGQIGVLNQNNRCASGDGCFVKTAGNDHCII